MLERTAFENAGRSPAHFADTLQAAQGRDRAQVHGDDLDAGVLQVRLEGRGAEGRGANEKRTAVHSAVGISRMAT